MIEAAVVVDQRGMPIRWHVPPGRTAVSLPDDAGLWDFIWKNKVDVSGIAHTHPGSGWPMPSSEDVTTFSAIELALGRRLRWWIASEDRLSLFLWVGPDKHDYAAHKLADEPIWLAALKDLSK